jgi:repressor LexA
MKAMGLSSYELGKAIDISSQTIRNWLNGTSVPSDKNIYKIASYFGTTIENMKAGNFFAPASFTENGEAIARKFLESYVDASNSKPEEYKKIPVLGKVPAGYPQEAIEYVYDYEEISDNLSKLGEIFGLIVSGDSMYPEIKDGDIAIVLHTEQVETGDIAVVRVNGDDVTIKRIKKNGNILTLIPSNEKYGQLVFTAEQIQTLPVTIVGKVLEIRRKFTK